MAEKRMFSKKIVDSDAFLDVPLSAQALYFHLGMRADDDGAVANAKRICSYIGANTKDLKLLLEKRFLLEIDGIIFIKHWKINNYIAKDRYTPTSYQDEYSKLYTKDNKSYTERVRNCTHESTQQDTTNVSCAEDTDKNREDKGSKDKNRIYAEDFEKFWAVYPKQSERKLTEKQYAIVLRQGVDEACLINAAKNYAESCKILETPMNFVKNPSNWLRDGTWSDYTEENYRKPEKKQQKSNSFNNFEQRDYDYATLEKELLEAGGCDDG